MTDASTPDLEDAVQRDRIARGSGPGWYAREAVRIARFDTAAIGRASRDRAAIFYGAAVVIVATLLQGAARAAALTPPEGAPAGFAAGAAAGVLLLVPLQLAMSALNLAIIHGAAKLLFGATGAYLGVLRALWLGSVVQWLLVIPVIGWIVGGIWSLLITLVVFEEVDGIERLQALALAVGFAAVGSVLALALS